MVTGFLFIWAHYTFAGGKRTLSFGWENGGQFIVTVIVTVTVKTVGGGPTASHFFSTAKKSNQKMPQPYGEA